MAAARTTCAGAAGPSAPGPRASGAPAAPRAAPPERPAGPGGLPASQGGDRGAPGRRALVLLAPAALALAALPPARAAALSVGAQGAAGRAYGAATGGDQRNRRLAGPAAAALTGAVYDSALERWGADEASLQRALARLRDSELPGFQRQYPDLRDATALMDADSWRASYFNFLSYCTWKVSARAVAAGDPGEAEAFYLAVGGRAMEGLCPGALGRLREAAARAPGGAAPSVATAAAVQEALGALQGAGYVQEWSICWGDQPGLGNPQSLGLGPLPLTRPVAAFRASGPGDAGGAGDAGGPGDAGARGGGAGRVDEVSGTVSPRADGLGDAPAPRPAYPGQLTPDGPRLPDPPGGALDGAAGVPGHYGPEDAVGAGGGVFQVRLLRPADLDASVAMRAEESGRLFPRPAACMVLAVLRAAGAGAATASESFFQDAFQPPESLSDRLLLAVGDPLFRVRVPWEPTSVVIDFDVAPLPPRAA